MPTWPIFGASSGVRTRTASAIQFTNGTTVEDWKSPEFVIENMQTRKQQIASIAIMKPGRRRKWREAQPEQNLLALPATRQ